PDKDIKMAPVPSVVDLCITTLQHFGSKTFAEIVQPALDLLDAGSEEWHPRLAHTLRRMVEEEQRTKGSRHECLQAACDRFYGRHPERNDIAEELEAHYIEHGGFLRRRDLAAHRTLIEAPVSVSYRGCEVYKCGPWTQGPFLCQALRLLEGFDLKGMGHFSADYVHVVVEAIKLAMADRDTYYGDPNFVDVPLDTLFSEEYNCLRRPLIDFKQIAKEARPGDPHTMEALLAGGGQYRPGVGGTTTCVVADRWGNVVAATPSANVYREGGSGQAGVSFGNRLRSLNTTPGHANCIAPGKRPRITLTPTLVLKDGKPLLAVSVAGGDLQDQATLNLLLDYCEFGQLPAAAVVAPRFATVHHQDSFDPNSERTATLGAVGSLSISDAIDAGVREELAQRGHRVEVKAEPIAKPVMLHIDSFSGAMSAAGDPAAGRHAAGLD
ncbi:MAG: gamma-glutamyltranspeptidase/glutathione hydrolase, partial [Candidatus Latescibacterota bacterium]